MARRKFRDIIRFVAGFILERPTLAAPIDCASEGSSNVLFVGQGEGKPFKGLEVQVGKIGGTYHLGVFGLTKAP